MGLINKTKLQQIVNDFHASAASASVTAFLKSPLLDASNTTLYDAMTNSLGAFKFSETASSVLSGSSLSLRVVVVLPDGTVTYDSAKVNTVVNAIAKSINENHNSRISFLKAFLGPQGALSYESKFSTSNGVQEEYVAQALGGDGESCLGAIRFSVY